MWVRRVQEVGRGTFTVSLPREWVERIGLSRGSRLLVVDGGSSLLLKPPKPPSIYEKEVKVRRGYERLSVKEILASYLLGYDVVRVVCDEGFDPDGRRIVKDVCRKLIGLEVVGEDRSSITFQCIVDPEKLDVEKTFDRLRFLVYTLQEDVARILSEDQSRMYTLTDRDDEVDRLYFLLVRLLRSPIDISGVTIQFSRRLDLRVAGLLLENIADRLTKLVYTLSEAGGLPGDLLSKLKPIMDSLSSIRDTALKMFIEGDLGYMDRFEKLIYENNEFIEGFRGSSSIHPDPKVRGVCLEVASIMEEIVRSYVDIADLTTPR
ncbi:MAG: phosphate uptake regulator PhoU [Candidatus Bathyarchaeia archaeon]